MTAARHILNLLDGNFGRGLAEFAGRVAARYPWVCDFTPVNEPLTTARFSALYGHWYPHARDDRTFARCLLNQCRAVVEAMRAIRRINPAARLVQTDDLAKVFSTPNSAVRSPWSQKFCCSMSRSARSTRLPAPTSRIR